MSVLTPPTGPEISTLVRSMDRSALLRWVTFADPVLLPLLANELASRNMRDIGPAITRLRNAPATQSS